MLTRIGCLMALVCLACPARSDDVEHRDFSIFIDGKESGTSRISIVQKKDGSAYMTGTLDVKFRLLVTEYNLKIESQEWWQNHQLVGMKTVSTENGKKTEVIVAAEKSQLRMRINGKDSTIKTDVWPSSYWRLADARFHNKQVPILEVDTGKELVSELKYIGVEKLKVGELQDCYHFRVTAASGPVDLWFDRYHRLVRQEFTESGHKTIVQLTRITR